jgi:pimeloyl-ACP methyl ester carboxylesterase
VTTEARRIDGPGGVLAAEALGDPAAPPLVMVMGATASMRHWPAPLLRGLAGRGLRVIVFDHRDTGASVTHPPGPPPYAAEDMARDVLAVMDGFGLARAHLSGMSLGGWLAQMVARRAPRRVASLTLIASEPLGWDGPPLPGMSPALLAHFAGLGALDLSDRAALAAFHLETARLCAGTAPAFDAVGARARIRAEMDHAADPGAAFNHALLAAGEDWAGAWRQLEQPLLILHGAEDPVLPPDHARALAAPHPAARLVILPGRGHHLAEPGLDRAQEIDFSLLALFMRATITVKIVMILLLVMSFWSWASSSRNTSSFRAARREADGVRPRLLVG